MARTAHINNWQYGYIKHCKNKYKTSYSNLVRQAVYLIYDHPDLLDCKLVLPTAYFKTERVHTLTLAFGKPEDIELFNELCDQSGWEIRDFLVLSIVIFDRFMSKNT